MTRSILDADLPDTPDSRLVAGINRLYSLARVGMAASDTSISVDLQKAGYTRTIRDNGMYRRRYVRRYGKAGKSSRC